MKICFYGNTNNYPFMLAQAMKKLGIDVTFIIDYPREKKLCRPEYRYKEIKYPYPDWILEIKPYLSISNYFPRIMKRKVIKKINQSDIVILNDVAYRIRPYLKKGIKSVSLLTGSDLEIKCNFHKVRELYTNRRDSKLKLFLKDILYRKLTKDQCKGIKMAALVNYFPPGLFIRGDNLLEEILHNKNTRIFFMMIDVDKIEYTKPKNNRKIKIFNATRFVWSEPFPIGISSWENKRNDIMIKGLGLFYNKTKQELDIHFIEKGHSISESKKLINELGISSMVTWHSEMTQKEVLEQYKQCDVAFEQLGNNSIGMVCLEAMATGRPVIGNARPEILEPVIGAKSPICQAKSPEEVSNWMERLVFNVSLREEIGLNSRRYIEKYFSPEAAAHKIIRHFGYKRY